MRQTSIKSDRVARLLDEIAARTGETKVEAVTRALEQRLESLGRSTATKRTLDWLEASAWADLGKDDGHAPSREEQEDLLGF